MPQSSTSRKSRYPRRDRIGSLEPLESRLLLSATPTTESVTPPVASVAAGTSIALTGRYSDANGRQDLRLAELRVANGFSTSPRCYVRYDFLTNDFKLFRDGGSFLNAGAPGSGNSVTNGLCTLDAAASAVQVVNANTVAVTINLTFANELAGTRNVWLRAFDKSNNWSTMDDRGDITITASPGGTSSGAAAPATPTTVSVTPDNASVFMNTPITLTGRYSDANGRQDIRLAELRVSSNFSTAPRCYARYDTVTNDLKLFKEGGTFISAGAPGGNGSVTNDVCTLNAAASSVTNVDQNTIDVAFNLSFTSALQVTQNLWLRAFDKSNAWSTPDDRGDINITNRTSPPVEPAPVPPTTNSVTPDNASVQFNEPITLTARFADRNGRQNIRLAELRVSNSYSSTPRCFVRYDTLTDDLKLFKEGGTFLSAGAPGNGASVTNGICTLDAQASTVNIVDINTIDVAVNLSIHDFLDGRQNIWLRTLDGTGVWSTSDDRGDLTVVGGNIVGGFVSVVDGYTDLQSYDQGTTQNVYINAATTRTNARIDLYNVSNQVVDSVFANFESQAPANSSPATDGFGYRTSFTYNIGSLPSGVYFWANKIPFVVKDTSKTSKIRVVLPTNTMNAYGCIGGNNTYGGCGAPAVPFVHFDRMMQTNSHSIPGTSTVIRFDSGGWSMPYFWWLEREIGKLGTTYGVLADIDLDDPASLDGAEVLVLPGHSEYWTRVARQNVDAFVAAGKDLAVMSGNSIWWQSRYENDRLVVYKKSASDPIQDPLLKTINWNHPSLNYSIIKSIGADFENGGYLNVNPPNGAPASFNGYKVVAQNSPLLEGVNAQAGDIIPWSSGLLFSEYDGPPVSGVDANGYPIINKSALGFHQVELVAFDHAYRNKPGFGTMLALQPSASSGIVVNAGSMLWAYQMTKSPAAAQIQKISFNILDKLLNNKPVFSALPPTPPPATASALVDAFWTSQAKITDDEDSEAVVTRMPKAVPTPMLPRRQKLAAHPERVEAKPDDSQVQSSTPIPELVDAVLSAAL